MSHSTIICRACGQGEKGGGACCGLCHEGMLTWDGMGNGAGTRVVPGGRVSGAHSA